MTRRLAELDRLDLQHRAGTDPFALAHVPALSVSVQGHPFRPLAAASKVVALVAVLAVATAALLRAEYGVTIGLDGVRGPERLLEPVHATGPGGSHAFMAEDRGRPVTYNPCNPIDIVVNAALAPPRADLLVAEAISEVEHATGLRLRVTGTTDEQPAEHRPSRQQDRYGDRWAPVLLAWTTPEQDPRLRGDTAGIAGGVPESPGMSGDLRIPLEFGPGDLQGLATLGNGSCL